MAAVAGMTQLERQHRRERNGWIVATVVLFAANAAGHLWWPPVASFVGNAAWVWCLVGVAYHVGWLRCDRDIRKVQGP